MDLSSELISQFVRITKDSSKKSTESTVNGTMVEYDGAMYVRLDGSDLLTPISTTTNTRAGERVTVLIKNHTATVTGNISSPAARTGDVQELDGEVTELGGEVAEIGNQISEFEIIIADKVSVSEFDAEKGRIDELVSDNAIIRQTLTAQEADISKLEADNVTINKTLTAQAATIENLETTKLDAEVAELTYATITGLEAVDADIHNLEATYAEFASTTTTKLAAIDADIANLDVLKLSAKDAELKYANIDFTNVGKAAMEYFYANSGLIENVVVGDGTITGNLVGVTIKGDLIEGGTVVADKLVILGDDGLYYKLNTNGVTTEAEQTDYNSLNGQIITAQSITASKISVDDLVAFDATIGGFNISESSIYSGVKESVDNTTRGIYLDKDGQVAFGDASNFIRYYKDAEGKYKLEISADSFMLQSGTKSIETVVQEEVQAAVDSGDFKGEDAVTLRIDSSRGTVFKNSAVSTVLSAVIYRGSQRITDITALKAEFGNGAYLEWQWQKMGESTFGTILSTDSRIGDGGFTFTLSPEDVDTKVVFMCQLITD